MFDHGDIKKKVKTYEDVAKYFTDFLNDLYAEEIKEGRCEKHEVLSPSELAMKICMMSSIGKMEDDRNRARWLENINELRERLDKVEELLDELEDRG